MMAPGPLITVMGIKTGPCPFSALSIVERVRAVEWAARQRINQLRDAGEGRRANILHTSLLYDELTALINQDLHLRYLSEAAKEYMEAVRLLP